MTLKIDHSRLRDVSEMKDGDMGLVKIKLPHSHQSYWVRCVKVDGQILWHEGGKPLEETPLGWLSISES